MFVGTGYPKDCNKTKYTATMRAKLSMYIRSHFYMKCNSIIAKCIGGCVRTHVHLLRKEAACIFLAEKIHAWTDLENTTGTSAYN